MIRPARGPLDGFGHRLIVVGDEGQDLVTQIVQRDEIASLEQLAHQNTQPDLDLVHPGGMLRRVVQHDLVRPVMQKAGPAFHRLQESALAFDAQRLESNLLALSDPAYQRCRLMDIQVVQHNMPLGGRRIAGNQALEVGQGILLSARRPPGWFDDLSGHDIEIDEPGQRAMPDVLEFASQHMAGLHRQIGSLAFQGLHAGQFIYADGAFSSFGPFRGMSIDLAAVANLLVALRIGHLV